MLGLYNLHQSQFDGVPDEFDWDIIMNGTTILRRLTVSYGKQSPKKLRKPIRPVFNERKKLITLVDFHNTISFARKLENECVKMPKTFEYTTKFEYPGQRKATSLDPARLKNDKSLVRSVHDIHLGDFRKHATCYREYVNPKTTANHQSLPEKDMS